MSTHLLISDNWLVFALILQSLPDFTHYKQGQNGYDMEIHFRLDTALEKKLFIK